MKYSLRSLMIVVVVLSAIRGDCQGSKRRDLDIANHATFASAIGTLRSVTMYEGLPRKTKLFASEVKTKES